MKYLKNRTYTMKTVFALIMLALAFNGCKVINEEEQNDTIFGLEFNYSGAYGQNYIDVFFTTNNLSEIPEVEINGEVINKFNMESSLSAWVEIPYSSMIYYNVSCDGKTTSGNIKIPQNLSGVDCNGFPLNEDNNVTYVPYASEYEFTWPVVPCDFQSLEIESDEYSTIWLDSTVNTYTIYNNELDSNYLYVNIDLHNGDKMEPGAVPGTDGSYGAGFVTAISHNAYFVYRNMYGSLKNTNSFINKEQKLERFVDAFNQAIE